MTNHRLSFPKFLLLLCVQYVLLHEFNKFSLVIVEEDLTHKSWHSQLLDHFKKIYFHVELPQSLLVQTLVLRQLPLATAAAKPLIATWFHVSPNRLFEVVSEDMPLLYCLFNLRLLQIIAVLVIFLLIEWFIVCFSGLRPGKDLFDHWFVNCEALVFT